MHYFLSYLIRNKLIHFQETLPSFNKIYFCPNIPILWKFNYTFETLSMPNVFSLTPLILNPPYPFKPSRFLNSSLRWQLPDLFWTLNTLKIPPSSLSIKLIVIAIFPVSSVLNIVADPWQVLQYLSSSYNPKHPWSFLILILILFFKIKLLNILLNPLDPYQVHCNILI